MIFSSEIKENVENTINLNNKQIIEYIENKQLNIINSDEIRKAIKTKHLKPENQEKIISLFQKYPKITKYEHEELGSTNLLKHRLPLITENPLYSRNYRYNNLNRMWTWK